MSTNVEIERKFLLDRLPVIPARAAVLHIEQGYLKDHGGRIRRTVHADGSHRYEHALKSGHGLVRREIEKAITADEFHRLWPLTNGRRVQKIRYLLDDPNGGVWAIDQLDQVDLVLAEIELPAIDTPYVIPPWLKPRIVREVTDDPHFTNAAIAVRIGRLGAPSLEGS